MKKIFLKSLTILLAIVTIWSIASSLQPIPTTTTAFQNEITLQKNLVINESFKTDFDYQYAIDIVLKDEISNQPNFAKEVDFKIISENTVLKSGLIQNFTFNESENYFRILNFKAEANTNYRMNLIFKGINDSLINRNSKIRVDVNGGGPSVGLALARNLKQYSFWADLFLSALTLTIGYFAFKRKEPFK